jgi:hypothetical protein
MIKNNKADTILNFNKFRYPLRPILLGKDKLKETLIVSVEPGTIIDIVKRQEFSVLEKREFFELKKGQSLCIVANVNFKKTIKSGDILTYELSDPNDEESREKVSKNTYQIYVNRYDIKDFTISVINQEKLESIKNYLQLCSYGDTTTSETTTSTTTPEPTSVNIPPPVSDEEEFFELVFNDKDKFNQMYVNGRLDFPYGVEFSKESEDPFTLEEPQDGEEIGSLSYYF